MESNGISHTVDVENGESTVLATSSADKLGGVRIVEENEDRDLSRGLNQRHLSMIALAGAVSHVQSYGFLHIKFKDSLKS